MATPTLEQRVASLERELSRLKTKRGNGVPKDWRRTIGVFTDDAGMKEIFAAAMKLRQADRKKANRKSAKKRPAKS